MTVLERNDQNGDFWGRLNTTLGYYRSHLIRRGRIGCGGRAEFKYTRRWQVGQP